MTKENLNIDKKEKLNLKDSLKTFKEGLGIKKENPILAYIEKFDEYFKRKERKLKAGEKLFSPGDDDKFYIIKSGVLIICKYTADGEKKEIGKAYPGSFIGEGIIFGRKKKDVEAIAIKDSLVLCLTENDLKIFEKTRPKEAIELYKHIIEVTNKRLLDSGKELASIYDATNKLVELGKNGEKGFIDIMIYFKNLLGVDYIMYIENHPFVDGLFFYKYNTILGDIGAINKKAGSEITKDLDGIIESKNIYREKEEDNIFALPLKNGDNLKGFFLIGKSNPITDNEIRISRNLAFLIGSIIDDNQEKKEKKAKEMSKNVFDNISYSI